MLINRIYFNDIRELPPCVLCMFCMGFEELISLLEISFLWEFVRKMLGLKEMNEKGKERRKKLFY